MNIPTVKDFMTTNVITASADDSMGELIEKLLDKNVSGAPVVNDDNEIVGLISGKDILQGLSVNTYHHMGTGRVADYMTTDVFTIHQSSDVFEASKIFCDTNYRRIPVQGTRGELVGIVTRKDVVDSLHTLALKKKKEIEEEWELKENNKIK